ncbi:uncharacterized protein KRP23_5005 [Phytophthora ramorum]|uniref:uncharacterized protein n=1 Tax=Phytophthora ramorum TaxID=164328 RepID=UPI00309D0E45|nr:hypothetical protein KRP23_5005 [Phytophthora ramorum]
MAVLSEGFVMISNWDFMNNTVVKNEVGVQGGSIYITKGNIAITDSQLISNDKATLALNGGIIYVENAETTLTIANSLLHSGQGYSGGLIYSANVNLYIKNSTLHRGFGYDYGAGIFAVNTLLDITDSYFFDNFAFYDGGAIYMKDGGKLTTRNSIFDYNSVQDRGGAIFLYPGAGVNCTVSNSNFTRNTNVGLGSTMFVGRRNTAHLKGCLISGNGGSGTEGGALNVIDAVVDIEDSVFEFNTATKGAAIQISRSTNLAMKRTIIRNNSASVQVDITVDKCNPGYENVNGMCLPCEKGTYSLDGEKCYLCPPGATCEEKDGSGVSIGVVSPRRQQGYFVSSTRSSYAASSCEDPESWPSDDPCKSIDISNLTARIHKCASEKPDAFSTYWSRSRIYSCLSGNEYYTCDTNVACVAATVSVSAASVQPPGQCAVGYSGVMCATCADGFYKGSSGSCKQCSDPNDPAVAQSTRMLAMLPMIVAAAAFVFLCYLFSNTAEQRVVNQAQAAKRFQIYTGQSRTQMLLQAAKAGIRRRVRSMMQSVAERARSGKQPRSYLFQIEPRAVEIPGWRPEKFKIMVGFFQIIGSFKNVYEIPWPDTMSRLMDICSLADFNFVDTTAAECLFKRDYFMNYRLALFALVGMLLLVFLVTSWGILRYRVKLSTLPRHCVRCGLPVFTLQHRAPPVLERRKTLVAKLKMEQKMRAAHFNKEKSSLFERLKSKLGISPQQTVVSRISQRLMRLAASILNRVDRLTQLPASISTHSPRCPTSQRIKNDVLAMVVHSNLRLWRARVWMRLYYKAYQNRCIKLFFWVLLLFYPMLSQRVIGTFYCDEVGSHYYLSLDRSNLCYEGTWLYYLPLSMVLIVVWVAGVPLLFWVIISLKRSRGVQDTLLLIQDSSEDALKQRLLLKMRLHIIERGQLVDEEKLQLFETEMLTQYLRDRNLNEPSTVAQVGFIYHSYGTAFWWFEVWDLGRKLLLNCIISLLAKAGANRVICGLVVLLVYLSVMLFYKPYRDPSDSALAGVTHIQLFITLFCGLILKMGLLYLDERVVRLVTNAAIITNVMTLIYAVFSILNEKRTAVKIAQLYNRDDHRRAIAKHVRKLWRMAYGYALTEIYLSDPNAGPMPLLVMVELARRKRFQLEMDDLNAQLELTSVINPPVAFEQQHDAVLSASQVDVLEDEPAVPDYNKGSHAEIDPSFIDGRSQVAFLSPDDGADGYDEHTSVTTLTSTGNMLPMSDLNAMGAADEEDETAEPDENNRIEQLEGV